MTRAISRRHLLLMPTLLTAACGGPAPEQTELAQQAVVSEEPALADERSGSPPLMTLVDMHRYTLELINTRTNAHAHVDLRTLPGWPGPAPLHTLLMPSGRKVYVSYMGSQSEPVGLAVIRIRSIDWDNGHAHVTVEKNLQIDAAGAPSSFPDVSEVDPSQPVVKTWNFSAYGQLHAPQLLRNSKWAFFNMWTDDRIFALDTDNDTLSEAQRFGERSRQIHGVHFNPAGRLGLSAGYYYDKGTVSLFRLNRSNGRLSHVSDIWLGSPSRYAAYVHTVIWLDDRYAVAGTMQFGPTSLTPAGASIIGPSVWLIDTAERSARQVIAPAATASDPGVHLSASYVALAGGKLFVAEEDSLDATFGVDGSVSVFDFANPRRPRFIKRFNKGGELPDDFNIAHAFSVTPNDRFVFTESWNSGYLVKIDVPSLEVLHTDGHDPSDPHGGLVMPHGAWIAGGH